MASLDEALSALRAADKAGNTEDAKRLAAIADRLSRDQQQSFGAADYVQSFGAGFNRGLINMAGAPVDLVNLGLQQIGLGSERPIGGTKHLRGLAESTETGRGMVTPRATDPAGRMISRVGGEIGASVIPAAGITGAAMRTAPAARGIWAAFANPIRNTPGRAATGELIAATGAGTGAAIAQEAAPGSRGAETIGQIAGGVAPSILMTTPTALVTRGITGAVKRFSPAAQAKAARGAVSDFMGEQLTPEAQRSLAEAQGIRQRVPGFEPSLGESTGSPALLAQQRRLESQASGQDLERLAQRRTGSEQAVTRFASEQAPGVPGSPDFIVDSASRSVDDLRDAVAAAEQGLAAERQDIAGRIPVADRPAAGQSLRERLKAIRSEAREQLSARADELGINDVDLSVPFGRFRNELLGELSPRSIFEDATNDPDILAIIRGMDQPRADEGQFVPRTVTFQDLKALRERISDDLMDAASPLNPNRRKVRTLTLMKHRLDDFIEGLDGEFGEAAGNWRAFRQEYFQRYIEPFEQGVAFKVRARDGKGFYRTPDEKVAASFFEPGNVSAARQFRGIYGAEPEANAALEAVALDSLRDAAVRDGIVQPVLLDHWVRRHRSVLDEFPTIRQAVQDIDTANASVIARQQQVAARSREVEDQILTRELDAFRRATRTGENVIDSALADPRKMQQLTTLLRRRPEALDALRRHVWTAITRQDAPAIARFLVERADSLRHIFTDTHLNDLKTILVARSMLARSPTPTGAAYVPRPLADVERMLGQGLPQLSSRLFALKSGRMQKGYLAVDTLLRGLRGRAATEADAILSQALYDPKVAKEFAAALNFGNLTPAIAKRLQARLFALGLPYLEDQQPQ